MRPMSENAFPQGIMEEGKVELRPLQPTLFGVYADYRSMMQGYHFWNSSGRGWKSTASTGAIYTQRETT